MDILKHIKARMSQHQPTKGRPLAAFTRSNAPPPSVGPQKFGEPEPSDRPTIRARPMRRRSKPPELPASYVEMLRQLAENSYKGGRKDVTSIKKRTKK